MAVADGLLDSSNPFTAKRSAAGNEFFSLHIRNTTMGRMMRLIFGPEHRRFFRYGIRHAVKFHSAFAREIALEQAMNFINCCQVAGDYLEFGVWTGRSFSAACYLAKERGLNMHFWAFDSFEGYPSAEGTFEAGGRKCSRERFLTNVKKNVRDLSRIHVVKGWYSDTLRPDNPDLAKLNQVAIAWIDCVLYESTKPVLEFLTNRLQDGSLLFFDDWFCHKGNPDFGEQKACREWLQQNPSISLIEYSRFNWDGKSFIVHIS
jgi:O-methyltransferase